MAAKILVVDPDPRSKEELLAVLAPRGYQVRATDDAPAALELAAAEPFDLVTTQLALPGVDGLSPIARLREREPQQEIVLLGDARDTRLAATTLRAGVTDYLMRPWQEADLALAVERCLERGALRRQRT